MQRVAVIGCGGAGKSTLARRLGRHLGLPVVHLDEHHWGPGWRPADAPAWRALHERIVAGEAWIIDGDYRATRRRAPVLEPAVLRFRCRDHGPVGVVDLLRVSQLIWKRPPHRTRTGGPPLMPTKR